MFILFGTDGIPHSLMVENGGVFVVEITLFCGN